MCGIVAYRGKKNATEVGFQCLKRLEYRGYDSYGGCVKTNKLQIIKDVGKIGNLKKIGLPKSNLAIFHTRWATHGNVTKENAHPHVSCDGKLAIVHNGIIENYLELRKGLRGHQFKSQTDTEVIVHLIEELRKKMPLEKAFISALQRLEGNYAIALIAEDEDAIYAARKGSPLIVGVGDQETFLASDAPAFLEYTNKAIFLGENEIAIIKDNIKIINNEKETKFRIQLINLKKEDAARGKFKHYMLKEIFEQKNSIQRVFQQGQEKMEEIEDAISKTEKVILTACGTAYHSAVLASYHFSQRTGKSVQAILASELRNFLPAIGKNSLIIAVSQSGETADVLSSVTEAKEKGAKVIAITNVMESTITRLADQYLLTNAGPEIAVASTKAFTSQVALLYFIAEKLIKNKNPKIEILDAQEKINGVLTKEYCDKIKAVCQEINTKDIFIIGRGKNYPIALETALKIKEISYLHAEGFAGGELKHGALALIEEGTPCIVFANKGEKEIASNAMEIKARGGKIIWISPEINPEFEINILTPETSFQELLFAIPAQLFAYYLGLKLKRDIDKPRNLAKSVTTK